MAAPVVSLTSAFRFQSAVSSGLSAQECDATKAKSISWRRQQKLFFTNYRRVV